MWALVREDGTIFRNDYPNQWAACMTAKKADGSHFKKVEAMALKSGAKVYRICQVPVYTRGHCLGSDGRYGPEYVHKNIAQKMVPYTLTEL